MAPVSVSPPLTTRSPPPAPPPTSTASPRSRSSTSLEPSSSPSHYLSDGFRIGIPTTPEPLISLAQVRAHLLLLASFSRLREDVQAGRELPWSPDAALSGLAIKDESQLDGAVCESPISEHGSPEKEGANGYFEQAAAPPEYTPRVELPPGHSPSKPSAIAEAERLSRELQADRRWQVYLHRAVHRFELYLTKILTEENLGFGPLEAWLYDLVIEGVGATAGIVGNRYASELPENILPPLDVAMVWREFRFT